VTPRHRPICKHDQEGRLGADQLEAQTGEHSGADHAGNDNRHGGAEGYEVVYCHGGGGGGCLEAMAMAMAMATRKVWKSKKMTLGWAL